MPILSKGYTFGSTEQVTSTKLGNLVDNATFASGASGACASGGGIELSSGQLQLANGGVTPTRLSTGAPTWDGSSNLTVGSGGNFTCGGTGTFGGTLSTSGNLSVNGTTALTGDATLTGKIVQSGSSSGRTVRLQTGSNTPNVISFGWDNGDLLVTIDGSEYKVTLSPA
jgi:hypothetical protein